MIADNLYSMQTFNYNKHTIGLLSWKPMQGQHTNGSFQTTGIVFDEDRNVLFSTRDDHNRKSQIEVMKRCQEFINNKDNNR